MSDLHTEFGPYEHDFPAADIIVLAGDIGTKTRGVEWAVQVAAGRPVIYVPGNHEFYGEALPRLVDKLRPAGKSHDVHVLDQESVLIGSVLFIGLTLWTDFALFGDPLGGMTAAQPIVMDYRKVRVCPTYRRLRPADTASIHARNRRWLEEQVAAGSTKGAVIVSHHAPSAASLAPPQAGDPVSASYASRLDDLVARSGAALWVHGHTHHCVDYVIGETRVLSNQRGYPDEPVPHFRPDLVVEIGAQV